ncbi:MAG: cupredoxin domain-containing protein [Sulfitobacter sp.]
MLKTLNKGVCALAVAASFMAAPAMAEDHSVLIMDGGYFPSIIYVNHGDSIIFTNQSDNEHTLSGPEESWVSEPIPANGTYQLNITDQMAPTFSGLDSAGELMEGSYTYEAPPESS